MGISKGVDWAARLGLMAFVFLPAHHFIIFFHSSCLAATTGEQELIISPTTEIALGEVWYSDHLEIPLDIDLPRTANITRIDGYVFSCCCMSASSSRVTLSPGKTQRVVIRINLEKTYISPSRRTFTLSLVPQTLDKNGEKSLTNTPIHIHGKVKDAVTIVPEVVNLGQVVRGVPHEGAFELVGLTPGCGLRVVECPKALLLPG